MAAEELRPGALSGSVVKLRVTGLSRARRAMTAHALFVERRQKDLVAAGGAHRYGTPTPAHPGSGPAVISGDLRRSITHTPVGEGLAMESRIGPSATPHSTYRHRNRRGANSAQIGRYLETGLRNGATYPFMAPAFVEAVANAEAIWKQAFGGWAWDTD